MAADPLRTQGTLWFRLWLGLLVWTCCIVYPSDVHAERVPSPIAGGTPIEVPKELLPWVPWVTQGITEGLCPKLGDEEICQWPAALTMQVGSQGAEFTFETYLEREGWVRLPGSASHWPENVEIDAKPAVVLWKDGAPATRLSSGSRRISGRFVWSKPPETLMIPPNVGLVRLTVAGESVEFPRREQSGALWLQTGKTGEADASDRVEVEVFRRIDDGVPLRITTQLLLQVSGRTRELRLAGATLSQSRALSIDSPVPARFEDNGELVLHATAGEHRLTLVSLFPRPPERIELPPQSPPWPNTETWVFVADNAIRQVELTGAPAIDAAQTNLPDEWKSHQAFLLTKGKVLNFETKRRGEPEPAPDQLKIVRHLMMDLDGGGYTVQDQLHAELSRNFRLDLAVAELGRVATKGTDLLITKSPRGLSGVELRQQKMDLVAEFRINQPLRSLPAVGWQSDVSSLSTNLHLPPGWQALHVTGADSVSDTWWSEWTLWGFFYVLLVSIAVAKLLRPLPGILTLATLVITHGRGDLLMALWGVLLALLALLRLVPESWFRGVLRTLWFASILLFAIVAVDFSIDEVRGAFLPTTRPPSGVSAWTGQIAEDTSVAELGLMGMSREPAEEAPAQAAEPPPPPVAQAPAKTEEVAKKMARRGIQLSKPSGYGDSGFERVAQELAQADSDSVVQTGPGIPSWRWSQVNLRWSGPVRADQRLHLYLLSPVVNTLLGCLRVLGVACLAILLVRKTPFGRTPTLPSRFSRPVAAAAGLVLLSLISSVSSDVSAQPRNEVLEELKTRLVKAPDCESCLEVESLEVRLVHRTLEVKALVHAGRTVDYRVVGPVRSWVPDRVTVDGKSASAMMLAPDGFLRVRLEIGTYTIQASGPVSGDELVISPGSSPHRVVVKAEGWAVDGLRDGRVENSLHFTAIRTAATGSDAAPRSSGQQRLPPWLEVTRSFEFGVTWRVTTQVTRRSPVGEPVSVRYALLPGEEVTTQNALVDQGQLLVALGRDDEVASYTSVLKQSPEIVLTAANDRPFSEEWRVRCGALWHCEFDGVAPFALTTQGEYSPRFRPWPGEKLTIKVQKPPAEKGASRTIQRAEVKLTPGHRLLSAEMSLTIRVSKTYTQTIRLEPNSTLQRLSINGRDEPIRMNGNSVEIQLAPGKHEVSLQWHEPRPQAIVFGTPRIDLGDPAVNAKLKVQLPSDRWLLFTWGPSWGPKVLLWSYLAMLIAASFILVRIPRNPLRVHQWVLLGVGLTQIPVVITAIIAAWFFLFALRGHAQVERRWLKKLMQLGLAFYTLVFLGCLCGAVYDGLVSNPDMLVAGSVDSHEMALTWYVDRIVGVFPTATVISLPVVVFRLLNLLWALWLASSLLGWFKWAWTEYAKGGLWVPPRTPPFRAAPGQVPATHAMPSAVPSNSTAPTSPVDSSTTEAFSEHSNASSERSTEEPPTNK